MVLSDRTITAEIEAGRIAVEPFDPGMVQPSSIDVRVDRRFRVFRNARYPYIDVRQPMEGLTELVTVEGDDPFILHPGEFVLGQTLERVRLPDDIVARLEGKSSLGRLGLLIHSSLPASEPVMILADGRLAPRPIGDVVRERLRGSVVAFDPETFEVGYHEITGWYEGPPDRIYEIQLASGRSVRVTAGHNLFTLDRDGRLAKTRTAQLRPGTRVAIPREIPDPPEPYTRLDLLEMAPGVARARLICTGPTVARAFDEDAAGVSRLLAGAGIKHHEYYRSRSRLPLPVAMEALAPRFELGPDDRVGVRGARHGVLASVEVDGDIAWLLGLYVAEGSRRKNQFTISNTDQGILDRAEAVVRGLGVPVYRAAGAITGCSGFVADALEWLGTGTGAHAKRVPPAVYGWPRGLVQAFLDGLVDGDGSREETRISVWTVSDDLASDVLLLAERLGLRAGSCFRTRPNGQRLWQVYLPLNEHKLLMSVPLPDRLLIEVREQAGLEQVEASRLAGYRHASDLNNIERRSGREAVRMPTLRRLRTTYARRPECPSSLTRLSRLIDGDLLWDTVVGVRDTGRAEPIFDLEVRPDGRKVENFLAGRGGIFVSNTAGFVDAGFEGNLTLELSNVANLPITIYHGMPIGQISFMRMDQPVARPYGSGETDSKYQGQAEPTPSRFYLNFKK